MDIHNPHRLKTIINMRCSIYSVFTFILFRGLRNNKDNRRFEKINIEKARLLLLYF